MRQSALITLVALSPGLLGTVLVGEVPTSLKPPETRDEFEQYVRQMDAVLESQVDEIAELTLGDDGEVLRRRFVEWREFVNLDCEIKARATQVELGELRCVSEALDRRSQEQEIRIAELEEEGSGDAMPQERRITIP